MISQGEARRLIEQFDAQRPRKAIEIGRLLAAYPSFRSADAQETVAAYLDVLEPLTMPELQRGITRAMRDQPDAAFVPSAAFVLRSALLVDEADAGYHPVVEAHVRARDYTRNRWQDLEDRRANLADLRILAGGGRPQDLIESLAAKLSKRMGMPEERTAVEKYDQLRADQAQLRGDEKTGEVEFRRSLREKQKHRDIEAEKRELLEKSLVMTWGDAESRIREHAGLEDGGDG